MYDADFQFDHARADDFDELMEVLLRCFRVHDPAHLPFDQKYPDLYRRQEQAMARNLVVRAQGRIVSCVGVFPVFLSTGEQVVEIGGIGGVCTLGEYRGRGLMQQLLDRATEKMVHDNDYSFAWLDGDRRRYRPWGYEVVPNTRVAHLGARATAIEQFRNIEGWTVRRIDPEQAHWPALWQQLARVPYFAACGEETLRLKYQRRRNQPTWIWLAAKNNRSAHVLASESGDLLAWAGDPQGVGVILARELIQGQQTFRAFLPPLPDDYRGVFESLSLRSSIESSGNLAILQLGKMLQLFKRHLDHRVRTFALTGTCRLLMGGFRRVPQQAVLLEADGKELNIRNSTGCRSDVDEVRLDCWQTVELFFSSTGIDYVSRLGGSGWLAALGPLPFHLPQLYYV